MNTTLILVLVVFFIASLVVAYFSGKRWNAANATLLFFVFWAAFEFLYLSTYTMNLHDKWRSEAKKLEKNLDDVQKQIAKLEFGVEDQESGGQENSGGVRSLRHQLHRLTLDRGRVWSDCQVESVDAATGRVLLRIENPDPHGIAVGKVLYSFQQGPAAESARYLDQGKVVAVGDGMITLESLQKRPVEEIQRMVAEGGLLRLYESLPVDRHDLLTALSEEELRAGLPKETLDEYLKDGKEASDDDLDERKIGLKKDGARALPEEQDQVVKELYVRRLRDYALRFVELSKEQTMLQAKIDRDTSEVANMQEALDQVRANAKAREAEREKLGQDLAKFQMELKKVGQHLTAVERQRSGLDKLISELRTETRRLAGRLTRWQLDTAEHIDQKTGI